METIQRDRYINMAALNPTSSDPELPVDDKNNSHPEENAGEAKFTKEESVSEREDDIVDAFEDSPLLGNGQSHSIMSMRLMFSSQLLMFPLFCRTANVQNRSFPVAEFSAHVTMMHGDADKLFGTEYTVCLYTVSLKT